MKHSLLFFLILFSLAARVNAQWSLSGNNIPKGSILGTLNDFNLNLYTNGTMKATITTSGYVGIGTASPLTRFHVNGFGSFGNRVTTANAIRALNLADDNAVVRVLRVDPTNAPAVELLSRTSANGANVAYWDFYAQPSDASFRIRDRLSGGAGLDRVTISNSGYVGIGTTSPELSLDVRSLSNAFGQFKAAAGYAGVVIDKSASGYNGYVLHRTAGVTKWTEGTIGNDNFSLRNWSTNTDALTVNISNNNIGIGTTAPLAKLHLSVNDGSAYSGLAITNTNTGGKTLTINQGTNGKLNFTEPSVVDLMTLDFNNQNVGIGTISPAAKLHVVGSTTSGSGIITSGYGNGLQASATGPSAYGVFATSGYLGVFGYAPGTSGTYGTYGNSNNIGAYGYGKSYGTYGGTYSGTGAYGYSSTGYGVQGYSTSSYGGYFNSYYSEGIVASTINGHYAGVFYGHTYASDVFVASDKNLKKDIHEFGDAMSIINKLKPQNYLFKDDAKYASLHLPKGRHYGLLAQDLEQVLPNLVSEAPHELTKMDKPVVAVEPTADGKPQPIVAEVKETKETINIKAVNYIELIPIMVKAMQEQQSQFQQSNEEKDKKIADLQNQINDLKSLILKNGNSSVSTSLSGYMKQNAPNPANNNTVISYYTPDNTRNAQILVTDMKGSVLRAYNVSRGEGQLSIRSGELPTGTYNYTLYINSNRIDTKQMIIAK